MCVIYINFELFCNSFPAWTHRIALIEKKIKWIIVLKTRLKVVGP